MVYAKNVRKKKVQNKLYVLPSSAGKIELAFILLLGALIFGAAMMGGLIGKKKLSETATPMSTETNVVCCDTGDGDACKPQTGENQKITYNGVEYGLIKSDVQFIEGNLHLQDSGQKANGNPIIINPSEGHGLRIPQVQSGCERPNPVSQKKDLYFAKTPPDPYMFMKPGWTYNQMQTYCTSIPDDQMVFVCKKDCQPQACSIGSSDHTIKCYGTTNSVYDVYFRLNDFPSPGIPDFIKYCDKTAIPNQKSNEEIKQKIVVPTGEGGDKKESLQLKTFSIIGQRAASPVFSPLCKPAIYLYPPQKTNINVQVHPEGPMTLTIPPYPANGWNVTAYPDGRIISGTNTFDYLYYEAEIPDEFVSEGDTGYVVEQKNIESFLNTILPKLGLNENETKAFVEYWVKALKTSPYFAVRIVSDDDLHAMAPLTISPKPDTVIRVTLLFTPLEKKISLKEPTILPKIRKGFTVVEWGGLYKQDKDHPFTCFM